MLTRMRAHSFLARAACSAFAAASLLLVFGCSDDGGVGKRYRVSGTVTYKGAPLEKGVVNFIPEDRAGRGDGGQIDHGSYTLTTLHPKDGALPGKYKVTVDDRQIDEAKLKDQAKAEAAKNGVQGGYNMVPQTLQANAFKNAKSSIPGKYQIAETSDLTVEVKPQSNRIDLKLTE